ncbi:hypothetical protein DM01DRAFT_1340313 [Hesseltinella vesiculosa]|uniref:Chromatin modification-related protein n=1 Tax=Hesseltinella vesiculosa TaxID=101127 RepID=A0A1X2G4K6_9FUNG|nr:hypothetical protein DM01DRAFT_1340313 [Hesseltinella vesiculosa]
MKSADGLVYLDDYIDTIESLPIELQRNFTLLRELDGYSQELVETTSKKAIDLIDHIQEYDATARNERLRHFAMLLTEALQRGEEKVTLAKATFDAVQRHCNRLDADLVKFEEDHNGWPDRITSLPGMTPSSRFLKENIEIRDRAIAHLKRQDRKEKTDKRDPSSKKRKTTKDEATSKASKDQKSKDSKDKGKATASKNGINRKTTASDAVDPSEPVYCYCQQVSFGEMVGCDNDDCDLEWFHLACVNLKTVPKGKWYCATCSAKMKATRKK